MSKNNIRERIFKIRKKKYFEIKIGKNFLNNILHKIGFSKKKIIGGYFPINFEIDCLQILNKFYSKGYSISLPIIRKNQQMDFYIWEKYNPLTVSSLGIPQPKKLKKVYPDILFVPIVAFDKYRNRVGYGGGFYDRYIARVLKFKKVITVGLAFSFQELKAIPRNKFDQKLDFILTEKGIIK